MPANKLQPTDIKLGPEHPIDWGRSLNDFRVESIDDLLGLLQLIGKIPVKNEDGLLALFVSPNRNEP